jgi:hypothetical protein
MLRARCYRGIGKRFATHFLQPIGPRLICAGTSRIFEVTSTRALVSYRESLTQTSSTADRNGPVVAAFNIWRSHSAGGRGSVGVQQLHSDRAKLRRPSLPSPSPSEVKAQSSTQATAVETTQSRAPR